MSRRVRRASAVAVAILGVALLPASVTAHAIDDTFRLPVPLWLYQAAAGVAVAASFVVSIVAVRPASANPGYARRTVPALLARLASVLLALAGLAWWFGALWVAYAVGDITQLPGVLFWVGIWVGLPLTALLLGNPWPSLSPFRTVHGVLEWLGRRVGVQRLDLGLPYPRRAARWPAVFLLAAAIWSELVLPAATSADRVGPIMAGYTVITLLGMIGFGRVAWLRHAELFEVLLGWFGRIGPIGRRVVDPEVCSGCELRCDPGRCVDCPECAAAAEPGERAAELRPWVTGLSEVRRAGWSDGAFIILALAGVTYDGMRETPLWEAAANFALPGASELVGPYFAIIVIGTAGLIGLWLAFFLVFVVASYLSRLLNAREVGRVPLGLVTGEYAATLLPIAGGYLVAHYATLVIQNAIFLPDLLRDPLVSVAPTLTIPAAVVWYLSVAAIVAGHVAAVVLAHRIALRDAPGHPIVAGLPLVLVMIGYTVLSLWIIAQPIALEPTAPTGWMR
ncbi:MAG TPA: hypothetical protein VFM19_02455 [Candidatus Limnocylindria bacterium]|nr:hypothetical protein [Candidatus Limnocylindria bacterium]